MSERLYGKQTALGVANLSVSRRTAGSQREFVAAFGLCKQAAARANARLGALPEDVARAIAAAAQEVVRGDHDGEFVVDLLEGSGGTSTNMNFNEVIASRASHLLSRPVHANDEVNRSQSTNDVYPAAMKLAVHAMLGPLSAALADVAQALRLLAERHAGALRLGRTCLQDAQPMTYGQLFGGWQAMVANHAEAVEASRARLLGLPLGGTAIGTGFGAAPGYRAAVLEELHALTGVAWSAPRDSFHAMQSLDAFVSVSGELRAAAASLGKIAQDLVILGSGPSGGIAELRLPAVQAGSSIMPGKVNPVIPMAVVQVAFAVIGNDVAVAQAQQAGLLEINHYEPLVASRVFDSIELLRNVALLLRTRCLDGLEVDTARSEKHLLDSAAIATAWAPRLGYDAVSALVKEAQAAGCSFAELLVERGIATRAQVLEVLRQAVDEVG